MGVLAGRRVLVTGVTSESSIGFAVARAAQEHGAQVVVSDHGRGLRLARRVAARLPRPAPVLELDVTDAGHLERLPELLTGHLGGLDGLVHSVAHGNPDTLFDGFVEAPWDDVAESVQVSAYSLVGLTRACLPLLDRGGAVVGLTFDATVAWPGYGWMGVAKAALESSARYLARDLGPHGVRVNLVSAGPLRTLSARAVPGSAGVGEAWAQRAPLGWDVRDAEPVARAVVALLSDLFPATTGEVVHVDGGFHATGM